MDFFSWSAICPLRWAPCLLPSGASPSHLTSDPEPGQGHRCASPALPIPGAGTRAAQLALATSLARAAPRWACLQDSHCLFTKIFVIKVIPKPYTAFLDFGEQFPVHQTLWLRIIYTKVWRACMAVLCHVKQGISSEMQGFFGSRVAYFTRPQILVHLKAVTL